MISVLVVSASPGLFDSFEGFMQMYQLQTENDEEETWRDLVSLDCFFFDN